MLFSNYQKTVIGGKEMGKYETLAKDIVKNVGGKENVTGLVHCITRTSIYVKG